MTLAVIALGVAALIVSAGLVANLYRQLAEAVIHSQTGHLEIATPAFFNVDCRSSPLEPGIRTSTIKQDGASGSAA